MKYCKLRIAWSVEWGVVAVLLCGSFVSCQQKAPPVPSVLMPGPRNVDWKESLGETLPALADVSKITWVSPYLSQPVTVPSKDWPQLISVLNESVPGSSGTTIPVIGTVEITKHDGQLVHVSVYGADEKAIVYQFYSEGDARSGREYYSSGGMAEIAKILPAIPINPTVEPTYVLHYSILGLAVLAVIVAVWSRARFSLRTLLIVTTLVAVGLGLIVWLT